MTLTVQTSNSTSSWTAARQRLATAVARLELDQSLHDTFAHDWLDRAVRIPVLYDDGALAEHSSYGTQYVPSVYTDALDERHSPSADIERARAVAMWSTWTCALLNVPLGGLRRTSAADRGAHADAREADAQIGPGRARHGADQMRTCCCAATRTEVLAEPLLPLRRAFQRHSDRL